MIQIQLGKVKNKDNFNFYMFLKRYANVKRLGKGAYGEVLLVQDTQDNNKNYALKLIDSKKLNEEPMLEEYLEGQIACMKSMNSQYIMKLQFTEKDEDYHYLFCEYCNSGDLINYQSKLKDKVFTLDKATEVLAQVISGLELLHQKQYLHRDIKPQNILVSTQNGKEFFKLADFGFSKKVEDVSGTILGTDYFMAPEIFLNKEYGFGVDMWAFGVLMYFMLNMDYPFKINPRLPPEKKSKELMGMAQKFNYKQAVQKTRKQKMQNCTQDVQDIFAKMFDCNAETRLSFYDIRKHKLFQKYFPVVQEASKILYNTKKEFKKPANLVKINPQAEENINRTSCIIRKKDKDFPTQKELLEKNRDKFDFLYDSIPEFLHAQDCFKNHQILCLVYNLLKYYIILMRDFRKSLNVDRLNENHPGLKWKDFSKTLAFKQITTSVEDRIQKAETQFNDYYWKCEQIIDEIKEFNEKFEGAFKPEVQETQFKGSFKQSYRNTTMKLFTLCRNSLKNPSTAGNKTNYIMCMVIISHAFNNIFQKKQQVIDIFGEYFTHYNKSYEAIDYTEIKSWMSNSKAKVLNQVAKRIIKHYFT